MTAVENVDVVREWFEAFERRDMARALELAHPEIELRPALVGGLEGRVYRGRDGVREFVDDVDAIWTAFRVEVRELRDAGDTVIVLGHTWGGGRDGIAVDAPGGWLLGMSDGKIRRFRSFNSWEETLEAAGVDSGPLGSAT
jgi:ketosteroid isomerase-like protein